MPPTKLWQGQRFVNMGGTRGAPGAWRTHILPSVCGAPGGTPSYSRAESLRRTTTHFKQRVGQLLFEYGEPADGQELSYLSKLVRGMPKRLAKCRARKYGRCGK